MLSVTQIAKKAGVSRATILYYERAGLLLPACRSDNGYRWYGKKEERKLESIMAYRSYGVPVNDIATLLEQDDSITQEHILQNQFNALELEIQKLRRQQKAIVMLLQKSTISEQNMVNKERWVEIMKAAGFSDTDMKNWHTQFEKMEPQGHLEFLQSLNISDEEIETIRQWSK